MIIKNIRSLENDLKKFRDEAVLDGLQNGFSITILKKK